VRRKGHAEAYAAMAAEMDAAGATAARLLGMESAGSTPAEAALGITVSYWWTSPAARAGSRSPGTWSRSGTGATLVPEYRVRVATVHREYAPGYGGRVAAAGHRFYSDRIPRKPARKLVYGEPCWSAGR